ncbi:MAG: GNAT family N-acetyltransferase [Burkholderiaceae bacterium]
MAALNALLRPLAATDSLESLTALLHRAYSRLGAMGLNFTAVDQTVDATQRRVASGQCFVAEAAGALVGTVTVCKAYDPNREPWARATPWFYRRDVAHLHQLAVDPAAQGQGLGDRLIAACEEWACEQGRNGLALDTAATADHLRRRYAERGFRDVDEVQWAGKRYRSVLMLKPLAEPAPQADDNEHRSALVRTLWAHVQARDWAAMRAAFASDAVMDWPCTGERLLDADAIVRANAIYPEGWQIRIVAVDALVDGRVHSVVEVTHPPERFFASSTFRFIGSQVAAAEEYWATVETPPEWRNAATIGAYERIAAESHPA